MPTLYSDRNRSCGIKAADGSQHLAMDAQALQSLPQQQPWHVVKGALKVQETHVELLSPLPLALADVLQGKQLMDH